MSVFPGADDVVLRVGGSPENVRTARLVAAAVARREGLPEDRVDEVRIAVGEAVTWAMHTVTDHVVELVLGPGEDGTGEFVVRVGGGLSPVGGSEEAVTVDPGAADGLALALLRGLADHVTIEGDTTVLTWSDVP
ncbi:ATP-binding protein [Aquipuribacter sp. MA13-6]|uniref:ATP-binding protein n=1 Tax=unclassified Aquipuribacter TaxID=2635084 RepID=UPI003EEFACEF